MRPDLLVGVLAIRSFRPWPVAGASEPKGLIEFLRQTTYALSPTPLSHDDLG
jgi:hypothetical protein